MMELAGGKGIGAKIYRRVAGCLVDAEPTKRVGEQSVQVAEPRGLWMEWIEWLGERAVAGCGGEERSDLAVVGEFWGRGC